MRILDFPITRLRNQELAAFASSVIAITEKHNPETLKISETFNTLKSYEPKISLLSPSEKDDGGAVTYKSDHKERKDCVKALLSTAKGVYDLKAKDTRENAKLVYPIIKAKLSNYYDKNIMEQNEAVMQLLNQIDSTPEIKTAVLELGFKGYIDQLRDVHKEFFTKYEYERAKRSNTVRKLRQSIKKELRVKIEDFFYNLYLAKKFNPDVDYTGIENELGEEVKRVNLILSLRKAASVRSAAKAS